MKKIHSKNNAGFTLIELLVVIAIIGLLSSIVFASLNSARGKAKDTVIKQELRQWANLMALNYNDNGGYNELKTAGWITDTTSNPTGCNSQFSGIYATQARAICATIVNSGGQIYSDFTGNANVFSVMSYLSYSTKYACVGSSGANSDTTPNSPPFLWLAPGCIGNP